MHAEPLGSRIHGLDLARAIAIAGMVLVNFQVSLASGTGSTGWFATLVDAITGRASATFVVLAGMGVSLLARRPAAKTVLVKRALFLLAAGYGLCLLGWGGDILHYYGIYMLVCCLLLGCGGGSLWGLAILLMLGHVGLHLVFDYSQGWVWESLNYVGFWEPSGMVRNLFFNGFHPVVPWLAFMLVGMWMGRLELESRDTQVKLLVVGVAVAVLAEVFSRWGTAALPADLGAQEREDLTFLLHTDSMPPMPLYMIAAGATTVVVIAACLLVCRLSEAERWLAPSLAAGRMALTLYVAHILVLFLWESRLGVALQALVFLVVAVLVAWLWTGWVGHGPLEYLLRRVSRGRLES